MRFWLGLAIGLLVGAVLGWAATSRPWRAAPARPVAAPGDAGAEIGKSRRVKPGKRRGKRDGEASDDDGQAPPEVPASGRAMAWRGPAISLPAREIDYGGADTGRPLENAEIDGVLERSSGPVVDCIREALAGAELRGDARLQMLVGGDGAVSRVRVGAPRWLLDHGFADCASSAARRMRFPATGAPTVVDAPYHID